MSHQPPMTYMHGQEWLPANVVWVPSSIVLWVEIGDLVLVRHKLVPHHNHPGAVETFAPELCQGYVEAYHQGKASIRVFDKPISAWVEGTDCTIDYVGRVAQQG